ncbi:MAG: ABC transporter substrate-binding protein [Spirochaetales bacterium]|nr:ABC transporter substrate-binding protein [Spirochaetales bacterium]
MKRFMLIAVILVSLIALPLFAAGEQEGADSMEYKVLHMYTALDTEEAKLYIDAFTESTGIEVEYVRMGSGEVLARIEAEKENPQASVWFGGSNTSHINAAEKGLLAPYTPNIDFTLSSELHAADHKWNGFYTGAIGFVSNKEFLEKNGLTPPDSWADLLDPAYRGQIEMAYPYTSGTAYTTWATRIQMLGMPGALDWWEKFDANINQYTKSGTACIARVGLGEASVGISFSHDILAKGIAQGYPVVLSFPSEGTGYEVGAISMIKGGTSEKESVEAAMFIDWIYSTEAQNLFKAYFRIPVNPNAEIAEGALKLSDITLIEYDAITAGIEKDSNVTAWRDRIGK